ncbi:hypothetical protein niasHS_000358 [Heterodera schachtii]|uniref:Meckel syndrome type 1 protein n=1 Tax=Heterodera schachtii TaxID=97005 RepID=A0ABD2K627_HETSC
MDGINSLPIIYDIDGDVEQLQFCISLFSVDQSVGTFLAAKSEIGAQKFVGESSDSELWSNAKFGEERLEEQRHFGWMEKVPKPTVGTPKLAEKGGQKGSDGAPVEEEEEQKLEEEENEKEVEEREGKHPTEGQRRRSTLSHRIFTFCDSEATLICAKQAQNEKQIPEKRKVDQKGTFSSTLNNSIQFLSSELRRQNRSIVGSEQRMQIMAYLGSDHIYDPSEEYLLWNLRVANGRRFVTDWAMDRTRGVQSAKTGKVFRAQLTVKEPTLSDEIGEKGQQKGAEEAEEKRIIEEEVEGAEDFEMPERSEAYWAHWTVEIGRGVGSLRDNLRVEWALEMPQNCQCLSSAHPPGGGGSDQQQKDGQRKINGMTQRCAVKSVGRDDVAHFGYPMEFTLNYDGPPANTSEEAETKANNVWPRMTFTVTAEDSWGRIFVEGFAVLPLPISFGPSPVHFWLNCVRPISPLSKVWTLRQTHIGQAEELAQLRTMGEQMFCQEGMATELGGKLELTVRTVHQSRQYISSDILQSLKYNAMMRRIGISEELQCRIAKVLEEFDRVRRQLIRVRKGRSIANA